MDYQLYLIYDRKAEAPVSKIIQILSTDAEASRMFSTIIQSEGSLISQHPNDFDLLNVGTINFHTLKITPNLASLHQPVITGAQIVRDLTRAQNGTQNPPADPGEDPRQLSIVSK